MKLLLLILVLPAVALSQSVSRFLPSKIDPSKKYVFYLHGRIVQEQEPPISKDYGLYDYPAIVKALQSPDYYLITERRAKGTDTFKYAKYLKSQIDTLIQKGVPHDQIYVVGASMGAGIAMEVSRLVSNSNLNYAVLALCSPDLFTYVKENKVRISGSFLSIYEDSDEAKSCEPLIGEFGLPTKFKEVALTMGNRHGFIYKPYKEWVDPLKKWIAGTLGY